MAKMWMIKTNFAPSTSTIFIATVTFLFIVAALNNLAFYFLFRRRKATNQVSKFQTSSIVTLFLMGVYVLYYSRLAVLENTFHIQILFMMLLLALQWLMFRGIKYLNK
jgi:hypothetical protein